MEERIIRQDLISLPYEHIWTDQSFPTTSFATVNMSMR